MTRSICRIETRYVEPADTRAAILLFGKVYDCLESPVQAIMSLPGVEGLTVAMRISPPRGQGAESTDAAGNNTCAVPAPLR